ncbi:MAG TPA: hypothetical protein VK524_33145 [Polyangiaceae bacterium]|nr:hypothetical protein [Polyangiaceae bacterium]
MAGPEPKPKLQITWPLREDYPTPSFPADPAQSVNACAPPSRELHELEARVDLAEAPDRASDSPRRSAAGSLPPGAPEWMQAARALSQRLEELIARGRVDAEEYAAIARTWAAWSLGGVSPVYVLRVAHLVTRAHSAIRDVHAEGGKLEAAYRDAAGVLHGGLPSVIRNRMPYERMALIVRQLRQEPDQWAAVVEVTSTLLGWKDYARQHAAAVIRAAIEQGTLK